MGMGTNRVARNEAEVGVPVKLWVKPEQLVQIGHHRYAASSVASQILRNRPQGLTPCRPPVITRAIDGVRMVAVRSCMFSALVSTGVSCSTV